MQSITAQILLGTVRFQIVPRKNVRTNTIRKPEDNQPINPYVRTNRTFDEIVVLRDAIFKSVSEGIDTKPAIAAHLNIDQTDVMNNLTALKNQGKVRPEHVRGNNWRWVVE